MSGAVGVGLDELSPFLQGFGFGMVLTGLHAFFNPDVLADAVAVGFIAIAGAVVVEQWRSDPDEKPVATIFDHFRSECHWCEHTITSHFVPIARFRMYFHFSWKHDKSVEDLDDEEEERAHAAADPELIRGR